MRLHDIIEIVTTDCNCRKTLRRVRVSTMESSGGRYHITGVNLQGKFPKNYSLPKRPIEGTLPKNVPDFVGWFPFNNGQGDE